LKLARATTAGIIDSAPKRTSEDRVWSDITIPIARPEDKINGHERHPISKSCERISSSSNGRFSVSAMARNPKIPTSPTVSKNRFAFCTVLGTKLVTPFTLAFLASLDVGQPADAACTRIFAMIWSFAEIAIPQEYGQKK
jgi:hypothetical protein